MESLIEYLIREWGLSTNEAEHIASPLTVLEEAKFMEALKKVKDYVDRERRER